MFDSLSGPMRSLLSRVVVLLVGAAVGLALYAVGVADALVVPLAVIGALVIGELFLFAAAERP